MWKKTHIKKKRAAPATFQSCSCRQKSICKWTKQHPVSYYSSFSATHSSLKRFVQYESTHIWPNYLLKQYFTKELGSDLYLYRNFCLFYNFQDCSIVPGKIKNRNYCLTWVTCRVSTDWNTVEINQCDFTGTKYTNEIRMIVYIVNYMVLKKKHRTTVIVLRMKIID